MKVLSIYILLLKFVQYSFGINKEFIAFHRVPEDDNKRPSGNILHESDQTQSLSECMSMCSKWPDSSSFFYNNGMKTCFCTGTVNGVDLVHSDGFSHFSSKRETLNWKTFGRSVYLQLSRRMKLGDAQVECMELGAKIAEIDSEEENNFLKEIAINLSGDVLIGATDVFKEGSWVYLSSWKRITFTDWAPGEPNSLLFLSHIVSSSNLSLTTNGTTTIVTTKHTWYANDKLDNLCI